MGKTLYSRLLMFGTLISAALIFSVSFTRTATQVVLYDEIEAQGAAVFYEQSETRKTRLWTVTCRVPLRGCVARGLGLILRLDDSGGVWLIGAITPDARVSVQSHNGQQDMPSLFYQPLSEDDITLIGQPKAHLVIEEPGLPPLHLETTGMAQVVSYLRWLGSHTARGLRDARLWPRNTDLDLSSANSAIPQRYVRQEKRLTINLGQDVELRG